MFSIRWLDSFADNVTPKISGKNRYIMTAIIIMYIKTENYRRYKFFSVIYVNSYLEKI